MIHIATLVLIALAPLPFGAAEAWAWAPLAGLAGLLVCLAQVSAVTRAPDRPVAAPPLPIWPAALLYSAVLIWILVQRADWTPTAWHHPFWTEAGRLIDGVAGRIGATPDRSLDVALRLGGYAALFWLGYRTGQSERAARRTLATIAFAAAAYALYGIAVQAFDLRMVAWEIKRYYIHSVTGPFVNRNSFATYVGLGLLCALALILDDQVRERGAGLGRRERLRRLVERLERRLALPAIAALGLAAGLFLTGSRGGTAATLLGLLVLLAVPVLAGAFDRRTFRRLGLALGTVGILLLMLGGGTLLDRLSEIGDLEGGRQRLFALATGMLGERPLLGIGAGAFETVAASHRTASNDLGPLYAIDRVHSSYLENAVELGLPAALALYGALGWVAFLLARGTAQRRDGVMFPAVGLAATALVGAHAAIDFSMQLPAVAATYALLAGTAAAQSRPAVASATRSDDRGRNRSRNRSRADAHDPFSSIGGRRDKAESKTANRA